MRNYFWIIQLLLCIALAGCATSGAVSTATKATSLVLEVVGLKKPDLPESPELPELQKPPRSVLLRLHAGNNLNAGATDKPLSVIVRIYKLKQLGAFYAAPHDSFLSAEKEKQALGADLVEVREINMIPGQLYETTEKISRESGYLAIAALYRSPSPQRWRVAFSAKDAESQGLTLGLHACSISVGKGASTEQFNATLASAPARCD